MLKISNRIAQDLAAVEELTVLEFLLVKYQAKSRLAELEGNMSLSATCDILCIELMETIEAHREVQGLA